MNYNVIASLFALLASVVFATYSNNTFVPTTVTLTPTQSVETTTSTLTYEDETTTFYITSTLYSTYWYTPVTTSSVNAIVTDIPTTFESTGDSYTSTITSTITSTLQVIQTISSSASIAPESKNGTDLCVPVTKYVTVGTVTVTPEPVTKYVTVSAGTTSHQWNNGTQNA